MPDTLINTRGASSAARQRVEFRNGNEAAALAAAAAGFRFLGYFPVTPAAEIAEGIASMRAQGSAAIEMLEGAGGDGTLGVCYGASLGGARALAAMSSRGILASLDQLAVQAASRVPIVLNTATRAVCGRLDSGCDHSDLYHALDAGWIVLCARDPQAVYDLNLAAVRIGEHPRIRLPVLIAYDGFVTSHQKHRIQVFDDAPAVASFLGERPAFATPFDADHPLTFGAPMEEPDLLAAKRQLSEAMEAARRLLPGIFAELEQITGRAYPMLDGYWMSDAEAAVVLLNSAAEAARDTVDQWRASGGRVGLLSPNVLRPFPADDFRAQLHHVKAVTVADRADSYGADGGRLSMEVRAAIQLDPANATRVLSRIYGVTGGEFLAADAQQFLHDALEASATGQVHVPFAYHGATDASEPRPRRPGLGAMRAAELPRAMAKVRRDEASGRLAVELEPAWKMTAPASRFAPGHGACPGCGALAMLHQVYNVLEGEIVALFHSGCAMAVTASYPATAHRINVVHNPAGNGASTLAGLAETWRERVRRGELAAKEVTFLMITGDGGMDAELGAVIGLAGRAPRMMILEYDNEGRMSTGAQLSHSTPLGHRTPTTEVGRAQHGNPEAPIDTAQILAACHLPYVFTASEGYPEDLMRKVAKAQWYAKNEGLVYGKILSFCPLHWKTGDDAAESVLHAAIDCCSFPLYEVERGHTTITYDPEAMGRRRPVAEWLELMGKSAHLVQEEEAPLLAAIERDVERRWRRLKAMHESASL